MGGGVENPPKSPNFNLRIFKTLGGLDFSKIHEKSRFTDKQIDWQTDQGNNDCKQTKVLSLSQSLKTS